MATAAPIMTGNVVGKPKHIDDLSEPELVEAANRAVDQFNIQSNSLPHGLVRIVDATKQLVAGLKYTLELELAPLRDGSKELDLEHKRNVKVVAVHQAWMKEKKPEMEWQFSFA